MKKNSNALIIIAVAALIIIWYGGNQGWFKFTISMGSPEVNLDFNTPQDSSLYMTLSLNPSSICVGGQTKGSISSNMPNAVCALYYNTGSGYQHYKNIVLDSQGSYGEVQTIVTPGTATFRAACFLGDKYKISNEATLTVTDCTIPDDSGYDCSDSDNGINFNVAGHCEDSFHQLGFMDECVANSVKEWYCDAQNICQYATNACPTGWACIGGACAQPSCTSIINPTSQASCDVGSCSAGGDCYFFQATLYSPARCGCGV